MMKKGNAGRPALYKEEYADQAYNLTLMGADNPGLAMAFGVATSTIDNWISKKPEFMGAIRKGKDIADAEIANSLYHRAKGYSHPDVDIRVIAGEIVETAIIKHYPPDTAAAFIWLKNRQRKYWRDRPESEVNEKGLSEALSKLADKLPD